MRTFPEMWSPPGLAAIGVVAAIAACSSSTPPTSATGREITGRTAAALDSCVATVTAPTVSDPLIPGGRECACRNAVVPDPKPWCAEDWTYGTLADNGCGRNGKRCPAFAGKQIIIKDADQLCACDSVSLPADDVVLDGDGEVQPAARGYHKCAGMQFPVGTDPKVIQSAKDSACGRFPGPPTPTGCIKNGDVAHPQCTAEYAAIITGWNDLIDAQHLTLLHKAKRAEVQRVVNELGSVDGKALPAQKLQDDIAKEKTLLNDWDYTIAKDECDELHKFFSIGPTTNEYFSCVLNQGCGSGATEPHGCLIGQAYLPDASGNWACGNTPSMDFEMDPNGCACRMKPLF